MPDIARALHAADLVAIAETRTALVKQGATFTGNCPFHAESLASFSVDAERQTYTCRACGAYGNAITFLRELDGLSLEKACAELVTPSPNGVEYPPAAEWKSSRPPTDVALPSFEAPQLGFPTAKYAYKDAGGAVTGWALRYEAGAKLYMTWGSAGHVEDWAFRNFARPRPLYGLDRFTKEPTRQVLLVDDEATAEIGAELLRGLTPMAWPGDAAGVQHADYSPLDGASIVLLPRHDEAGRKAIRWLREHLIGRRCVVKIIEPEETRPAGWSLDQAEDWEPDQAKTWARERLATSLIPVGVPKRGRPLKEDQSVKQQIEAAKLSEIDLSDIFVRRFGDNWRYVEEWETWFKWAGDTWREDKTGEVRECCANMLRESGNWTETAQLQPSGKRALCSHRTISAVVGIAKTDRRIAATSDQWDTDPWLLGVPGGVIDLREGKLVEAMQEDHITRQCAVAPAPGEPAMWLGHLERTQKGDQQVIGFLHRYFGYMLTGVVDAHALVFFYGTGRNGKGSIINTVIKILGDYGYVAPVNLITESKTERHPVELAMLRGTRAVSFSEPPKGSKWDDGRIRSLTGGDPITARKLNQNPTTFQPTHKLLGMGNHKPVLRSVDEAIKARFNLVDFTLTIPEEEQIKDFPERLRAEWPQILNWMIQGCLEWQRVGLGRPGVITRATAEYLDDEDTLGTWIADCCEYKGGDPIAVLYKSYAQWSEQGGERPMSSKAFSSQLYERPGITRKRSGKVRSVVGLQLTQEARTPIQKQWVPDD